MTNEELIAKYNPANARNLSNKDLEDMRNLTTDQIKVLAEAYPNGPRHRAYLVLHDNNVEENRQMNNLSTWQNLYNVRKFSGMKNLVPSTFRELFQRPAVSRPAVSSRAAAAKTASARKVIDLSPSEAAAELKQNAAVATRTAGAMTASKAPEPSDEKQAAGTKIAEPAQLNDIKGQQAAKAAGRGTVKAAPPAKSAGKGGMKAVKAPEHTPAASTANVPADQDFGDPSDVSDAKGKGSEQGGGQ